MASATAPAGGPVVLDVATHTYTLEGEVIPGVTGTLKDVGIIDYSFIPQEVLLKAGKRGTAVHVALQYFDHDCLDLDSLDPEHVLYVEAYRRFLVDSRFVPAMIERQVFHPTYRYAGTLDRTGEIGGDLVILDFKTGLVLPGHALQLAAYCACLPLPRRFRRIALKLNNDGTYKVHEYPLSQYQRDLDVFLAALACRQFKQLKGIR